MTAPRKLPRGITERRKNGRLLGYRVRRAHRKEVKAATYEIAMIEWRKLYADNARRVSENRTLTFGRWLTDHLRDRLDSGQISASTHATYAYLAETHIQRLGRDTGPHALWHAKLIHVHRELLKDLLDGLEPVHGGELSGRTVHMVRTVVTMAMDGAIAAGHISGPVNPVRGLKLERSARTTKKTAVIDGSEIAKLMSHMELSGERLHALYVVSMTTGIRQAEALGLRWQDLGDLDAETCELHVNGQLGRSSQVWKPKTKTTSSERALELSASARMALKVWRQTQAADRARLGEKVWRDRMEAANAGPSGLVFTRPDGRPLAASSLVRHLRRMLRDADIGTALHWHELRHSYTTWMLTTGALEIHELSKLLGHSSIRTTLDIYGHLTASTRQKAASAIDAALAAHPHPERKEISQ